MNAGFVVELFDDVAVFFDGFSPDVDNYGGGVIGEEGNIGINKALCAGTGETNGVEHAAAGFVGAGGGVAEVDVGGNPFYGDGTEAIEINEFGIFGAVSEGAGGDGYGVLHGHGADLNGEIGFIHPTIPLWIRKWDHPYSSEPIANRFLFFV